MRRIADIIFVTSGPDRQVFTKAGRKPKDVVVVQGGVTIIDELVAHVTSGGALGPKEFAACFVGRFHPQKGVLELVDIWAEVYKVKPDARLMIIGQGELERALYAKIAENNLQTNIEVHGFLDGQDKHKFFKQSRMILHPALYDSGGMAACEGMAWGLPAVGFDLEAHKTYYPKGMLKAPVGDLGGFAQLILKLMDDDALHRRLSEEAFGHAMSWNWEQRAEEVYSQISWLWGCNSEKN